MTHDQLEHLRNIKVTYDPRLDDEYRRLVRDNDMEGLWRLFSQAEYLTMMHEDPDDSDLHVIESRMSMPNSWQTSIWNKPEIVQDKIYAAWLGRCVACCIGKPVEGMTKEQVRDYLKHSDSWPLTGYVNLTEYLPDGVKAQ